MSVMIRFWPELKTGGTHMYASLGEAIKARAPHDFLKLKFNNHMPLSRKDVVIGFIEGHRRPLPTRQSYLTNLYDKAYKSKRPSFLITTGWETEDDALLNPDVLKMLPEAPEGLRVYTCFMKLSDLQINSLFEDCLKSK